MASRTFAIGDIHGCDLALKTLCEGLELMPDDRLILLGDLVDRGPNSRGVIEYSISLRERCELIWLIGNHEEVMLESFESRQMFENWVMIGGKQTLESYDRDLNNIPPEHRKFLSAGKNYFETETEIFVHANLEPGVPLEQQTGDWLRWRHLSEWECPHESGKRIICGHTQQPSGRPLVFEGWVCLDTAAYKGNPLTCLEIGTDTCFRATQQGEWLPPRELLRLGKSEF
jgi:serine/threonine protein phosphatase 1